MSETTDFLALPDARPPTLDEQQQAIRDKVAAAVDAGFSEAVMNGIKKKIDEAYCSLQDNIEWTLKQDIQANLAHYVQDCARRSIEAMLQGNVAEVLRYLHCAPGYTGREFVQTWPAPFEPSPMALRRKLVEAFPYLIERERILDLEASSTGMRRSPKHTEISQTYRRKSVSTSEDSVKLTTLPYEEPRSSASFSFEFEQVGPDLRWGLAAIARIKALEDALMPFCQNGMAFSHARMNLDAAGNNGHPAGGTWVNLPEGVTFSKNETVFYNAIDVLGRARVHDYIMNIFEQTKQAMEAQENARQH